LTPLHDTLKIGNKLISGDFIVSRERMKLRMIIWLVVLGLLLVGTWQQGGEATPGEDENGDVRKS
jgi:hypothetical protein